MMAIRTKFLGPTSFKPARVKAWCEAGSVTLSKNQALDDRDNHIGVAMTLADKLGFFGPWHVGNLENGYVFVPGEIGKASYKKAFTVLPR